MRKLMLLLLLGASLGISGCYENMDVTLHEPGDYRGQTDPLLAKLKQPTLQEELVQRFKTGQTDR